MIQAAESELGLACGRLNHPSLSTLGTPLRVLIAQRRIVLLQVVHTNKRAADNVGAIGDKVSGVKALVGMPRFVYSVHKTDGTPGQWRELHHGGHRGR